MVYCMLTYYVLIFNLFIMLLLLWQLQWPNLCFQASPDTLPSSSPLPVFCLTPSRCLSVSLAQPLLYSAWQRGSYLPCYLFANLTQFFLLTFCFSLTRCCFSPPPFFFGFCSFTTWLVLFVAEPPALRPTPPSPSKCHSSVEEEAKQSRHDCSLSVWEAACR